MTLGKSIRIYLKDGTPTGVKVCELVNLTIQSISAPRLKTNELSEFKESSRPGVYFLFGKDEVTNQDLAYIGEAENVLQRLQDHLLKKEFWNEVVLFVSKDENLTKSHVKYLESRLIQIAISAKRYKIDNYNQPALSSLPLADRDAMEEFLLQIKMLIGLNGHRVLDAYLDQSKTRSKADSLAEANSQNDASELILTVSGIQAKAIQSNEGIVVVKGSDATRNPTPALSTGYKDLRQKLIDSKSLVINGDRLSFVQDTLFSSPSAAAAIIVGYNTNGLQVWKDSTGRTLRNIEAEKIKDIPIISDSTMPTL